MTTNDPRPDPRPEFPEMRRRFGTPTPAPVETIDHKAEAERLIAVGEATVAKIAEAAHAGNDLVADRYGKKAMGVWAQAQVHATLHLAEQQRIGNLIAYWQMHVPRSAAESYEHDYIEVHTLHTNADVSVDDHVRESLGLS